MISENIASIVRHARLPQDISGAAEDLAGRLGSEQMDDNLLALVSVYGACKERGVPTTPFLLAKHLAGGKAGYLPSLIGTEYNKSKRALGIEEKLLMPQSYVLSVSSEIAAEINAQKPYSIDDKLDDLRHRAEQILDAAQEVALREPEKYGFYIRPENYAAAALYCAAVEMKVPASKRGVSDAIGISEVGLRNICNDLAGMLGATWDMKGHQAILNSLRYVGQPKRSFDEAFAKMFKQKFGKAPPEDIDI